MRILAIILITFLLSACNEKSETTSQAIRPIMWTKVTSSTLEQVRTLSGVIAPVETANLSFEVHGKLDTIDVNLGDEVKKDQELAKLNQRNFELGQQSAKAQYQQAIASLLDAKSNFERFEKLIEQGVVSQSGYDNAKAVFDSSKSAVDVAKAQLDIATKNLQDSVLVAPYDGVITKRVFEPSQQVSAGQLVFEIEGKHGLEVHVMVPETLIRQLKKNTIIPIRFPVLARTQMQGRITEIGTRAEAANAFPVTVILQGNNPLLRAGMSAEVDFSFVGVGQTGYQGITVSVPFSALRAGINQKTYTYVYNPATQTVHQREVQTENVLNNMAFISSGLKEGEIIATAGVAFLRDGQAVTLLDKKTQRFN